MEGDVAYYVDVTGREYVIHYKCREFFIDKYDFDNKMLRFTGNPFDYMRAICEKQLADERKEKFEFSLKWR